MNAFVPYDAADADCKKIRTVSLRETLARAFAGTVRRRDGMNAEVAETRNTATR